MSGNNQNNRNSVRGTQGGNTNRANQQVIFVDRRWLEARYGLQKIGNSFLEERTRVIVHKQRKAFIDRLREQGNIISYDEANLPEDAIYLSMGYTHLKEGKNEIGSFAKKIEADIDLFGGEALKRPISYTVDEYLAFEKPPLPFVFKNTFENRGVDKFPIRTLEQIEKIRKFREKYGKEFPYNIAFAHSKFEQLIKTPKTPSEGLTSMRLLVAECGEIMAASLLVSTKDGQRRDGIVGPFEKYFWDESSEFYLGSERIVSNYAAGGENIIFGMPEYSPEHQAILQALGFDPHNPKPPEKAVQMMVNIAKNKKLGVLFGADVIFDGDDNNECYFLELQTTPGFSEYLELKYKIKEINPQDLVKYDLLVRQDAVNLGIRARKKIALSDPHNRPKTKEAIITKHTPIIEERAKTFAAAADELAKSRESEEEYATALEKCADANAYLNEAWNIFSADYYAVESTLPRINSHKINTCYEHVREIVTQEEGKEIDEIMKSKYGSRIARTPGMDILGVKAILKHSTKKHRR